MKKNKCVAVIATHNGLFDFTFLLHKSCKVKLSQISKRRSTPETRAGQYMCPECGKIFDTKKEVDKHTRITHDPNVISLHNGSPLI